jgi:hypothetical protein
MYELSVQEFDPERIRAHDVIIDESLNFPYLYKLE